MIFTIIALTVMVCFYCCHFAVMLNQKKKGIRTNQMGKGKTGSARLIEQMLGCATVIAPAAEFASIILKTDAFPLPVRTAGAVMSVLGLAVFIAAITHMRDSWRAGVPTTDKTRLVTDGIYKISRNPAFLGFDLIYLGILLMFFNWWHLLAAAFAAVMIHIQIVTAEEEFLHRTFGKEYEDYKMRVNRYIGRAAVTQRSAK